MNTAHSFLSVTGLALLTIVLTILPCQAEDSWNIDGEHEELHIYCSLRECACHLDMRSTRQDVVMKSITIGKMNKPGDKGESQTFELRLLDCQRIGGTQTNHKTGLITKDIFQPIITISFAGALDPDDPSLLLMKGVSGTGLMISDRKGQQLYPGERGLPQFVSLGSNELVYDVTPVRTLAPLVAGTFQAIVDFRVSYD